MTFVSFELGRFLRFLLAGTSVCLSAAKSWSQSLRIEADFNNSDSLVSR